MDNTDQLIQDLKKRMDGAIANLKHSLNGLRTGRVSASILDPVKVDAYGDHVAITQLANVSTPESQLIVVQVWDRGVVKEVEKAIREFGLGLNPIAEGQTIRIPVPPLTQDRRKEIAQQASKYSEQGKIAVRNVRRDSMDAIKKMEKDKKISEDEMHACMDEVQKITDAHIKQCDDITNSKISDIMQG